MKLLRIFAAGLAVIMLTSCDVGKTASDIAVAVIDTYEDTQFLQEYERKSLENRHNLYEYFKIRDADSITALFCNEHKQNRNLTAETKAALDFIDGDIISCNEIEGKDYCVFDNVYDYKNNTMEHGKIENVKTDKGKTYKITFVNCRYFSENSDEIGMLVIRVTDKSNGDSEYIEIGKFIETLVPRALPDEYQEKLDNPLVSSLNCDISVNNLLAALKNRDEDGIYNMFSEERKTDSLKSDIGKLFDFIDGNIVSYGRTNYGGNHKKSEPGGLIYFYQNIEIFCLLTDSGELYYIDYDDILVSNKEPSALGIQGITVQHMAREYDFLSYNREVLAELRIGE